MQFSLRKINTQTKYLASLFVTALTLAFFGVLFIPAISLADQNLEQKRSNMNFFENKLPSTNVFDSRKGAEVVHVVNEESEGQGVEIVDGAVPVDELELQAEDKTVRKQPLETIDRDKPAKSRPASEKQPLRIEKDAPSSIRDGFSALVSGDKQTAQAYASRWTQYMTDMMFYIREWTALVAKTLHDQGKLDEEGYYRAPDMIDQALVEARKDMGSVFSPSHQDAMRKVEADPKGEVEVLYFFSLNCKFCRTMASDVERLHQATKNDPNVRMTAVTLGKTPDSWLDSYKKYTGLTLPIAQGEKVARQLQVAFVPAVVVVTSNSNKAYIKSGEQSFENMYEFVRVAQGLSGEMTSETNKIKNSKVGQAGADNAEESFREGTSATAKEKKISVRF